MEEKAADIVAHSFLIPAAEVQRTLTLRGMTEDALLRSLIVPASKLARPYVSNFYVGCEPHECIGNRDPSWCARAAVQRAFAAFQKTGVL